jgi:hypothetical protein
MALRFSLDVAIAVWHNSSMENDIRNDNAAAPVGSGKLKRYEMREDSGASEIIEAESLDAAMDQAREWAAGGSYDQRVMVSVYVDEIDADGEAIPDQHDSDEVAAGPEPRPPVTDCGTDDDDHDWQNPIELVGGLRENPGVSSTGTRFDYHEVCARCGLRKHSWDQGTQRNPGQLDEGVEYEDADELTLAWVAEQES